MKVSPTNLQQKFNVCYFFHFLFHATRGRFFSLFFKEQLSFSDADIGTLLSVNPVVRVLATPLWGYTADKYLSRRFVYILSVILTATFFCLQDAIPYFIPDNEDKAFFVSIGLRCLESFFNAPFYSLMDAEILGTAQDLGFSSEKSKEIWGKARTWGSVGWGLSSFGLGLLIQYNSDTSIMLPLNIISGLCLSFLAYFTFSSETLADQEVDNLSIDSESTIFSNEDSDDTGIKFSTKSLSKKQLSSWQALNEFLNVVCFSFSGLVFIIVVLVSASGMVLVEGLSFLFFVEELHFDYFELGILVLITVLFELPLFYYAGVLTEKLGIDNLLFIGLMSYSSRVFIYTILTPEYKFAVIAVEWLHGVTIAAVTCARTLKIQAITPRGYESFFQSILWGVVSFGSFLGEFLGGRLFESLGQKQTYQVASLAVLLAASLHLITSLKKHSYEEIEEASMSLKEREANDII